MSSRVILTASNYHVFDHLEDRMNARALAHKIRADRRATEILLDALTGMGLLRKEKSGYVNTPSSSKFLVSTSEYYQGDIIRHADRMWDSWSNLDRVIKTGKPCRGKRDHESFILGMHNLSELKAGKVLSAIGLRGVNTALDLGGGPGTYAIEMAKKNIQITLFDAPETEKYAKKVIRSAGLKTGAITFVGGDFFSDDIGKEYDLILVSQICHAYSERKNIMLMRKCRKALRGKGRVVIHEFLVNEKKTEPLWSALFAINMLVHTDGGRTYTPGEMKTWLLKAGFSTVKKVTVPDGVLMVAER